MWASVRPIDDFVVVTNAAGNHLMLPNEALVGNQPISEVVASIQRWIDGAPVTNPPGFV